MSDDPERLSPAFSKLRSLAAESNLNIHPSFFVELTNYSRHIGVQDLEDPTLNHVIEVLGRDAIEAARARVKAALHLIGGGAVRTRIGELCPDPTSDCYDAAQRILGRSAKSKRIVSPRGSGASKPP